MSSINHFCPHNIEEASAGDDDLPQLSESGLSQGGPVGDTEEWKVGDDTLLSSKGPIAEKQT